MSISRFLPLAYALARLAEIEVAEGAEGGVHMLSQRCGSSRA
jgi:hypothetical protein